WLHERRGVHPSVAEGLEALLWSAGVDHVDLVAVEKAFEHLNGDVVRAVMKAHADGFVAKVLGVGGGRVLTDENRLTGDCRALGDDLTATLAVVRTTNLAPLARAVERRFTQLERGWATKRADELVVDDNFGRGGRVGD